MVYLFFILTVFPPLFCENKTGLYFHDNFHNYFFKQNHEFLSSALVFIWVNSVLKCYNSPLYSVGPMMRHVNILCYISEVLFTQWN